MLLFTIAPYARIHRDQGELIDHIFRSEEYFSIEANQKRRRPVVDALVEGRSSIGDNPNERAGEAHPDHAPIGMRFEVG